MQHTSAAGGDVELPSLSPSRSRMDLADQQQHESEPLRPVNLMSDGDSNDENYDVEMIGKEAPCSVRGNTIGRTCVLTRDEETSSLLCAGGDGAPLLPQQAQSSSHSSPDIIIAKSQLETAQRVRTSHLLVLSACCFINHGILLYGQSNVTWTACFSANVDVWLNASSPRSMAALDHFQMPHNQHIEEDDYEICIMRRIGDGNNHVSQLTLSAIHEKVALAILVVSFGIWPHLLMVWLNVTLWCCRDYRKHGKRMKNVWMIVGLCKYSLIGVFVASIMAVATQLNLTITNPSAAIEHGVDELPQIIQSVAAVWKNDTVKESCDHILAFMEDHGDNTTTPHSSFEELTVRTQCHLFINKVIKKPYWAQEYIGNLTNGMTASGNGSVAIGIKQVDGIPLFCCGVLSSILLSILSAFIVGESRHDAQGDESPISANSKCTWKFMTLVTIIIFINAWIVSYVVQLPVWTLAFDTIFSVDWIQGLITRSGRWRQIMHSVRMAADGINLRSAIMRFTVFIFCVLGPAVDAICLATILLIRREAHLNNYGIATLIKTTEAFNSWHILVFAVVIADSLIRACNHGGTFVEDIFTRIRIDYMTNGMACFVAGKVVVSLIAWCLQHQPANAMTSQ